MSSELKRKIGLDAMRSAAILSVLLCHFLTTFAHASGRLAYPFGVLGVELFFVLSGYLICHVLLAQIVKKQNAVTFPLVLNFWLRRWFRTLPNYYLFLAVSCVVFHFYGWPLLRYATFTQNFFHAIPGFFNISWSLAVEEWFYLLFPGLILVFKWMNWRTRYAFISAALILFAVPLLWRLTYGAGHPWDTGVRKTVMMRLDAIMWGVFLAVAERYRGDLFRALQGRWIFTGGMVLLVALTVGIGFRYPAGMGDFYSTRLDSFWFCGFDCGAALILPFCVSLRTLPVVVSPAALYISLWSYSIYLCNVPIIFLVNRHLGAMNDAERGGIALGLILVVSALVYTFFEAPILRLRERF